MGRVEQSVSDGPKEGLLLILQATVNRLLTQEHVPKSIAGKTG